MFLCPVLETNGSSLLNDFVLAFLTRAKLGTGQLNFLAFSKTVTRLYLLNRILEFRNFRSIKASNTTKAKDRTIDDSEIN